MTGRPRYWPILTPTKCSCTCGLGHASEFWASWVHLYGTPRCIMVQKNSTGYKRAHHDGDVHANCQPKQYSWMTNDQLSSVRHASPVQTAVAHCRTETEPWRGGKQESDRSGRTRPRRMRDGSRPTGTKRPAGHAFLFHLPHAVSLLVPEITDH